MKKLKKKKLALNSVASRQFVDYTAYHHTFEQHHLLLICCLHSNRVTFCMMHISVVGNIIGCTLYYKSDAVKSNNERLKTERLADK